MKRFPTLKFATALFGAAALFGASLLHAQEMKLRMGHVFAVDSPMDQASQEFVRLVKERTNGRLNITLFPNSQLGGELAQARELSRGSQDLALLNPGSLAGLDPLLDMHYLPYIATNFDAVDKVFYKPDGIIQKTLKDTLSKHKIETMGFFELEFRAVTNSRRAIEKPEDMTGLKLRVPGSAAIKGYFEAAGAQVVAMPFPELFTSLQQGAVDGQDNGASITYESRLFETQKYMTLTQHVYAMGTVAASARLWSRLSDADKKILTDTAVEVTARQIQNNRAKNAEFMAAIEKAGLQVTRPTPEQMAAFVKLADEVWEKLTPVYGAERIAQLRKEAEAARSR